MKYFLFALGMVLLSCAPKSREAEKSIVDIDGLIDTQLQQLHQRKPLLTKEASVDASQSDSSWTPAASVWDNELEIFRSLGMLNQRIYASGYTTEEPLDDPQSNLLIRRYTNSEAPLRWLHVYYQENPERIRQLTGEVEEVTPLYSAHRRLTLWFEDDRGRTLLTRYEIVGYQKAALRDTVHFHVQGAVGW